MTDQLIIDDLTFVLRRSQRRSTVGITVDRDGSLLVTSPDTAERAQVEQIVRSKLGWVYRKLVEQDALRIHVREPEYVPGAGFAYLGRSYRLALVDPGDPRGIPPLQLREGRFRLWRDEQAQAAHHFQSWYVSRGTPWLTRRVGMLKDRIGAEPAGIRVRELGYRWGSCSRSGLLNFHWRTVQLPPRIVDYVIVHELIHLHEHTHSPEFWRRLERAMPDYAARKDWLARHGSGL